MKLNVSPVTATQEPQMITEARTGSVRGARRPSQSSPAPSSSTEGSSQAIWPPNSLLKSRNSPGVPQPLLPPTLPVSSPFSRPRPL